MTNRESELLENLKSSNVDTAIESAVSLCHEFLFPRGAFEEAEYLLFEQAGLQGTFHGNIIELTLAETYFKMGEFSRGTRFLETARSSNVDSVRQKASELRAMVDEKDN
jgi:hypothetical protein